jgi:hypothetical protein
MNNERIIDAITAFQEADTPVRATAALKGLAVIRAELQAEQKLYEASGAVQLPEGFVVFAMRVMKEAKKLREAGNAPTSLAYADPYGSAVWILPDAADIGQLITLAASALLLAVEPPTIEGEVKSP